jgi:hypothetical protein
MKSVKLLIALATLTHTAHADTLTVEVKPASLTWHVKKPVDVQLRVVNTSPATQKVQIWSCGWYENWKSTDSELGFERWGCDKNYAKDFELAPGKAWEQKLEMFAVVGAKPGPHTLRMAFTPEGSHTATTSAPVTITVEK